MQYHWSVDRLLEVRASTASWATLAKRFSVSDVTIGKIRGGMSYSNVTEDVMRECQEYNYTLEYTTCAPIYTWQMVEPKLRKLTVVNGDLEVWIETPQLGGLQVSSHGRVWSPHRHRFLSVVVSRSGYPTITVDVQGFKRKTVLLHRLVAEAFCCNVHPSIQTEVDHLVVRGQVDKLDCFYRHLAWRTPHANKRLAVEAKLHAFGQRNGQAKLTDDEACLIAFSTEQTSVLAARYSLGPGAINNIRSGARWKLVTKKKKPRAGK